MNTAVVEQVKETKMNTDRWTGPASPGGFGVDGHVAAGMMLVMPNNLVEPLGCIMPRGGHQFADVNRSAAEVATVDKTTPEGVSLGR